MLPNNNLYLRLLVAWLRTDKNALSDNCIKLVRLRLYNIFPFKKTNTNTFEHWKYIDINNYGDLNRLNRGIEKKKWTTTKKQINYKSFNKNKNILNKFNWGRSFFQTKIVRGYYHCENPFGSWSERTITCIYFLDEDYFFFAEINFVLHHKFMEWNVIFGVFSKKKKIWSWNRDKFNYFVWNIRTLLHLIH